MLIAQITDLHIGPGLECRLNEARLEAVVERLAAMQPDLVLATGDLTQGGDAASYATVKALLAPLSAPVLPVLGNHDDRTAFLQAFPDLQAELMAQYAATVPSGRILVLDTVERGLHGGAFCEERAAWLERRLSEAPETPTLIALHHPPVRSGIDWMDAGVDGDWSRRLARALEGRSQIVGLIAGHLHRPMAARFAGHPLIVGSSVAPQVVLDLADEDRLAPTTDRARIVEESPGFVLHRWTADGLVSHFGSARSNRIVAHLDAASGRIIPTPDLT